MINAAIYNKSSLKGVATNYLGYYSLQVVPFDTTILVFSYVGYKPLFIEYSGMKDTLLSISLESGLEMEQIIVNASSRNVTEPIVGTIEMEAKQVKLLPSLLGEPDLTRVLQLMPGVQSGKEGTGGIFVRGGSSDQNLILLDAMPIFNANHIGGFISVFNPSAINYLTLYRQVSLLNMEDDFLLFWIYK